MHCSYEIRCNKHRISIKPRFFSIFKFYINFSSKKSKLFILKLCQREFYKVWSIYIQSIFWVDQVDVCLTTSLTCKCKDIFLFMYLFLFVLYVSFNVTQVFLSQRCILQAIHFPNISATINNWIFLRNASEIFCFSIICGKALNCEITHNRVSLATVVVSKLLNYVYFPLFLFFCCIKSFYIQSFVS